uniref:Uncharacterized protein n=1 Tax=viral metagenome TaxID=1070528 RepID=A0A6H1ZBE8_9ZZZZ
MNETELRGRIAAREMQIRQLSAKLTLVETQNADLLAAVSAAIDIIERWNAGEDVKFGDVFEQLVATEAKAKKG